MVGVCRALLALSLVMCAIGQKRLPADVPICKKSDPEFDLCLRKSVKTLLRVLKGGLPEFGLEPMEPLHYHEAIINHIDDGPVNVKLTFIHTNIWGLTESEVKAVNFDLENNKIKLDFRVDQLIIIGGYDIDGKILGMFITGEGYIPMRAFPKQEQGFNIIIVGGNATVELSGKGIHKDGHHFIDLEDLSFEYKPTTMQINFGNLFNGYKDNSDKINAFLTKNWETIWDALYPVIRKVYSGKNKFLGLAKGIFDNVPIDYMIEP